MHIDVQTFLSTLPTMAYGMGGIFLVILLIMGVIWVFNKVGASKADKQ